MGISRARKQGKRLGSPKRIFDRNKARNMLRTMSVREVARTLGVSRGVIERALVEPVFDGFGEGVDTYLRP
jgi:hypothetical protein